MVSITHRRGAGRRGVAALPNDTDGRRHSQLRLTTGQQEYLTVHGFGPDATSLVDDLNDLVIAWDQLHRTGMRPDITVHPAGAPLPDTDRLRLVVQRRHTRIAITWPGGSR